MMLAKSVSGGYVSQRFGPPAASVASLEPAMYAEGSTKAWWSWFSGSNYYSHYHPGIDRANTLNSDVLAMEDGTVIFAGYKNSIDGNQVAVRINDVAVYSMNHLSSLLCKVGQHVRQGQVLAHMGMTGAATGPHTHEGLQIGSMLYDPALFLNGGPLANDPRVKPAQKRFSVNGAGVNVRKAPPDPGDRSNIIGTARVKGVEGWTHSSGIYRRGTYTKLWPLDYEFIFSNWREVEGITFAIGVTAGQRKIAVSRALIHWV